MVKLNAWLETFLDVLPIPTRLVYIIKEQRDGIITFWLFGSCSEYSFKIMEVWLSECNDLQKKQVRTVFSSNYS